MNQKILAFVEKLEIFKTKIKALHWDSNSLSQHELCDDIASRIADFQDQVSEVEQSIHGKLSKNLFKPSNQNYGDVGTLKEFVENVLDTTNKFYKELENMGDDYIGMRSDCESFLSDMQRKLYLVNFTLKEELKERLKTKINESMPKNLSRHDEVDKFMGRKPKSIKARINQIYRIVKKYGIDSKVYHDENWQAIDDYYRAISSLGCEVEMKPCGHLDNADSMQSDGGYCDYDSTDNMPRSKQYVINIMFEDGMKVSGYIKCMAAGSVEDPFSAYDTCIVLWPKNNRIIENKEEDMKGQVRLTEEELKKLVKESVVKILTETPLNYDIDNFSGRWYKNNGTDLISGEEYIDDEGYLDDPNKHNEIADAIADDEWEWGKDMDLKGAENDYSWDRFNHKPIAQGLNSYYTVGKGAVPREVDDAIRMRNKRDEWKTGELKNRNRMMGKYISGQADADDVGDEWDDLHYESKKPMKVTESELKDIIREAAMNLIKEYYSVRSMHGKRKLKTGNPIKDKKIIDAERNAKTAKSVEKQLGDGVQEESSDIEIKPSKKGTFTAAATKHGDSVQGFANKVLKNKDNYSTSMVKKANFAKNASKWKK